MRTNRSLTINRGRSCQGHTSSGLITAKLHGYSSPISVRVLGGDDLGVAFETDSDDFKNVQLSGPADFVYTGQIEI